MIWILIWFYTRILGFFYDVNIPIIKHFIKDYIVALNSYTILVGVLACHCLVLLNVYWLFMIIYASYEELILNNKSKFLEGNVEIEKIKKK